MIEPVKYIDVFNGDADGICSLLQLRFSDPRESAKLITGVKRDIRLLDRVIANKGDQINVLDISLDCNRVDVERLLSSGVSIHYFDHHYLGEFTPKALTFNPYINESSNVCTSLIVDQYVNEQYKLWAITGAFGDNLISIAHKECEKIGLNNTDILRLQRLGELINYNGYGASLDDLYFHPAELFKYLQQQKNPLAFDVGSKEISILHEGYLSDFENTRNLKPEYCSSKVAVFKFPNKKWSRRVIGVIANNFVEIYPQRNHLFICPDGHGLLTISVRTAKKNSKNAAEFCRRYAKGGGRKNAAGINSFPVDLENDLITDFINNWG
jgi:hypothetical protein